MQLDFFPLLQNTAERPNSYQQEHNLRAFLNHPVMVHGHDHRVELWQKKDWKSKHKWHDM